MNLINRFFNYEKTANENFYMRLNELITISFKIKIFLCLTRTKRICSTAHNYEYKTQKNIIEYNSYNIQL